MSETPNTYQPGWGEQKAKSEEQRGKHHHYHYYQGEKENNRRWGGELRMRDKQAYYGLIAVCVIVALAGLYSLLTLIIREVKAMPMDDPKSELAVDELRIHKVAEQDALIAGDSLAQAMEMDSAMIRRVQIETRPVYRQPRKNTEWYITRREWRDIFENMKRWRKDQEE